MHPVFHLPFPPSANTYYRAIPRRIKGRLRAVNILSEKGREYPKKCKIAIGFWPHEPITGRLMMLVDLFPPDKRKRDLDNYIKPLQDALTKCRIFEDDSQIDILLINRREIVPGGKVIVTIKGAEHGK